MGDAEAVALAFLVLFALMVETIYIAKLIAPRRPTPMKLMRYEAGNPESGPAKAPLAMQYLGYVLMLVALEPVAAVPLALAVWGGADVYTVIYIALAGGLIALAAAYYAYSYARRIELWRVSS